MTEKRVDDLKNMHLQATQAAQQAKAAVQQNANLLQQKLAERQKLLSQLDQARMQEQLNSAMATLSQTVGQDVPTFDEVRTKIEAQYAKALGTAELSNQGVEARMLEIEQAGVNTEAQHPAGEMRSQMGLPPGGQAGAPANWALAPSGPRRSGPVRPAGSGRRPRSLSTGRRSEPLAANDADRHPGDRRQKQVAGAQRPAGPPADGLTPHRSPSLSAMTSVR